LCSCKTDEEEEDDEEEDDDEEEEDDDDNDDDDDEEEGKRESSMDFDFCSSSSTGLRAGETEAAETVKAENPGERE